MRISIPNRLPAGRALLQSLLLPAALFTAAYAQPAPPAVPAPAQAKPMAQLPLVKNLKVIPLAGKGEMNDLERHTMAPVVVEVLDQNDRPVEGADVVFRFPLNGPGATFPGEKSSQTARTNAQGEAAAMGMRANNQVGSFEVHATATYGDQMGETTFSMSNVTKIVETMKSQRHEQRWWTTRKFKIAVVAGVAAAVTAIVLAKELGGSSSKTTSATTIPTITISPGAPSIGGP